MGRLALEGHGKAAIDAAQGDIGWPSFEALGAHSKMLFEERLRKMDEERWAAKDYRWLYNIKTDT